MKNSILKDNEIYYSLAYVFIQELFDNGINIKDLAEKYPLTKSQQKAIKEIYSELYGE